MNYKRELRLGYEKISKTSHYVLVLLFQYYFFVKKSEGERETILKGQPLLVDEL
jgi:hypothetical protein